MSEAGVYDKFIATAQRLIQKYGRKIAINKLQGYNDSSKPWEGRKTPTVVATPLAVVTDVSRADLINTTIQSAEKKFLIAAGDLSFEPDPSYTITDKGLIYTILDVQIVDPGDDGVLYKVLCKR